MNRDFVHFSLTHPETNPQLEPIRRVIESGVPTRDCDNNTIPGGGVRDPDVTEAGRYLSCTTGFDRRDARFITPERYKYTSLENPLLFNLTADEYRTLKRYQEERALPSRFLGQTTVQDNALHAPIKPPPENPNFQTTSQDYGKYQPNVHTMPYTYHGLDTKFTAKKSSQGNYRNHSLNL